MNKKIFFIAVAMMAFAQNISAHFGSKGPFGGTVACAIVNDSVVYLGTKTGGVFESTNSKIVGWRPRPVGLLTGNITALAHTGKYLFAGTAEGGVYIFNGYVGSDRYWIKKNNGLANLQVTALVALDTASLMVGTNGGGVFKTIDRGETWVSVNNADLHHLEITGLVKAGGRIIAATTEGMWASDNAGALWFDYNDDNTYHVEGTKNISYNAATSEIMVLNDNGLLKASVGASVDPVYSLVETGLPANVVIRSISNDGAVWYLATDQGVYASLASTISWYTVNTGLTTSNINVVVPFRNRLIAGTEGGGIFKINDMSAAIVPTWSAMNTGFNNLATYSMASGGDFLIAAATEKGVFVSRDLAASYQRANKGLTDSLHVNDLCIGDFCLLAATENAGVFFSADSGKSWNQINNGLMNNNIKKVFCKDYIKYAICSTGNVYISPLHSSSWTLFSTGLPSGTLPNSMAFAGNKVILGTNNGVYKAFNYGSWSEQNTNLSNTAVTSVAYLNGKVYAGTNGSGVFVADTTNFNWSVTAPLVISHTTMIGLDGSKVQAMNSFAGYVFASYKGGLLATSDGGLTWIAGGNQFNLPSFTDVNKIEFVTTRVFVTTQNNALYSNALSELPTVVNAVNDLLFTEENSGITVSPNPNNGQFSIASE